MKGTVDSYPDHGNRDESIVEPKRSESWILKGLPTRRTLTSQTPIEQVNYRVVSRTVRLVTYKQLVNFLLYLSFACH